MRPAPEPEVSANSVENLVSLLLMAYPSRAVRAKEARLQISQRATTKPNSSIDHRRSRPVSVKTRQNTGRVDRFHSRRSVDLAQS